MQEFVEFYASEGLTSCWGDKPDLKKMLTTFNARTFLQPQLNKAIRKDEKAAKGDVNPKVRENLLANHLLELQVHHSCLPLT